MNTNFEIKNVACKINKESVIALTRSNSYQVVHFLKLASRLYDQILKNEHFRELRRTNSVNSYYMATLTDADIKQRVADIAKQIATSIIRLNNLAQKEGLHRVLARVEELSLYDITEQIISYVEESICGSDLGDYFDM